VLSAPLVATATCIGPPRCPLHRRRAEAGARALPPHTGPVRRHRRSRSAGAAWKPTVTSATPRGGLPCKPGPRWCGCWAWVAAATRSGRRRARLCKTPASASARRAQSQRRGNTDDNDWDSLSTPPRTRCPRRGLGVGVAFPFHGSIRGGAESNGNDHGADTFRARLAAALVETRIVMHVLAPANTRRMRGTKYAVIGLWNVL